MILPHKEVKTIQFFLNELETCLTFIDNLETVKGIKMYKGLALGNIKIIKDSCTTLEKELTNDRKIQNLSR